MAIPAARLGLHYHAGGMRRLVTRLGLGPAKRLLLAGQTLDADGMLAAHMLDELHPDEAALEAAVRGWQAAVTGLAPLAVAGMKRHLHALAHGHWDAAAHAEDAARCAASADLAEGVAAWQARRPPRFSGR
jgi:enoyl-CoA hydratase/carnithine racemase